MKNIRKAKNAYIYDISGQKYFDLTTPLNIVGHSHRLLTTLPKNALSTAWNIRTKSIWHNRFRRLIKDVFGSDYCVKCAASLTELYLRMLQSDIMPEFIGDDSIDYLAEQLIRLPHSETHNVMVIEASEMCIRNKDMKYDENAVINAYWYPMPDIPVCNAQAVILPELYGGFTPAVFVIIKHDYLDKFSFLDEIECLPSFTMISAVNLYHIIANQRKRDFPQLTIRNPRIKQYGRMILFDGDIDEWAEMLLAKDILINTKAPKYSYLPINLEPYQIRCLNRIFNEAAKK